MYITLDDLINIITYSIAIFSYGIIIGKWLNKK